ncbi:MAG: hypothetical protein AAFY42_07715 [Pseudomonadota bacterium]
MLHRLLLLVFCITLPTIAHADIRATYSDGSVIEISDEGAIRSNVVSDGKWLIHKDGANYMLVPDQGTVKVLDADVVKQVTEALTPEFITMMVQQMPPLAPHPAGEVKIAGRSATGYVIDDEREVSFAVSSDPELARLGAGISHQFIVWTYMQGPLGELSAPLAQMLDSGAAVRIGKVDLVSVEVVELAADTFALPGEPLDWHQTEAVMKRTGLIEVG